MSDSHFASHHEFKFNFALPGDIFNEILGYLTQQECLTCMAVCRDWYYAIPAYTRNLWKEVHLSGQDAVRSHQRRNLCLGRHVKNVILEQPERGDRVDEEQIYSLVSSLIRWGCTSIESLEFRRCHTSNTYELLTVMKPLTSSLTRIKLSENRSSIDFMHVFYALPELTHFSYGYYRNQYHSTFSIYSGGRRVPDLTHLLPVMPSDYSTKITYLWLKVHMAVEKKKAILQKCPNLRCFIDICPNIWLNVPSGVIDLDSIFSWCPKIRHLEINSFQSFEVPDDHIDNSAGLRYLNITDYHEINQVARHLAANKETLQHLHFSGTRGPDDDWNQVLSSLDTPNLHTLAVYYASVFTDTFISMLNRCPALESLTVKTLYPLPLSSVSILPLRTMPRLRYFQCTAIGLDHSLSLFTLLERFPNLEQLIVHQSRLSLHIPNNFRYPEQLKYLRLHRITWNKPQGMDMESAVTRFIQAISANSSIEVIELTCTPIPGIEPLLAVARIPTLKSLTLELDGTLSPDGLLDFVIMLRKSLIDKLVFHNVRELSLAILGALAELPLLSVFGVLESYSSSHITHISKEGLQQMLSKSPRLTEAVFRHPMVVEDNDGNRLSIDQVVPFIEQQPSQYSISHSKPDGWNVSIGNSLFVDSSNVLRHVHIRCEVKSKDSVVDNPEIYINSYMDELLRY